MSQQKRFVVDFLMDAGAEKDSIPKVQKVGANVQEIDETDEPKKRLNEVEESYVMYRISWKGADEPALRWGDHVWFVPKGKVEACPTTGPAVQAAMAALKGDDKMWKLRFATEDSGLPREEDSRTLLNLQINDQDIIKTVEDADYSSTMDQFCGKIVGQVNINTVM